MAHRKIISFRTYKLFLQLLSLSVILVLLAELWVSPVKAAANTAPTLNLISNQTINDPPVVTSFNKTGIRGNSLAFTAQDFLTHYSDVENDPLSSIKVVSLPDTGTLKLDSETIALDSEIPANQLDKLTFVPSFGWYGETSFSWVASDSTAYSESSAAVEITYPYSPMMAYLPSIHRPDPPPAAFNKTSPLNGATGQPINLVLDWQDADRAVAYQYCFDSVINNSCDGSWISTGATSRANLSGLNYSTKYEWHSRASNALGTTNSNGSPTAYFTFTTLTPAWVTAFTENFEGTFPGAWQLKSSRNDSDVTSLVSWGKRDCKAATGSYGGWAVGGGSEGSGLSCNGGYPVNTKTSMIYGPFNLSQVKDGKMSIKLWYEIEDRYYDYVAWGVSLNGKDFVGKRFTGNSNGWITNTVDLKNAFTLGNVTGASQVWIGIWFSSDRSTTYQGAAVDNLVLSTCASSKGCTGSSGLPAMSELPDGIQVEPASESLP